MTADVVRGRMRRVEGEPSILDEKAQLDIGCADGHLSGVSGAAKTGEKPNFRQSTPTLSDSAAPKDRRIITFLNCLA